MELTDQVRRLIDSIDKYRQDNDKIGDSISTVINRMPVEKHPIYVMRKKTRAIPGVSFSMDEQFEDPLKMLICQLEDIFESVKIRNNGPLCVRPNFGTVFMPGLIGLEYKLFSDNYPWLVSHISRSRFLSGEYEEPVNSIMMKKCIETIQVFKEYVPDWIHIYMPDTQGPFDIAHLLYGNDIFYELIDDPEFVHMLLDFSTNLYTSITLQIKKQIDEPICECYHGHALPQGIRMNNGGVRVSEDTPTLLSPAQIDEFVLPYDKKALDAFGGGFIHFCGKNDYLLESYYRMSNVVMVNLGNPEKYSMPDVMKLGHDTGTTYFGSWPKKNNETINEYFANIKASSDGGHKLLLLQVFLDEFDCNSAEEIMKIWNNGG